MTQLLAGSLVLSALYALLAAGFVVVYRGSRVLNLAHGDLMMLGGYLAFTVAPVVRSLWVAALIAVSLSCLLGFAIYLVLIRPVIGQRAHAVTLVTVGLSILLRGVATLIWGSDFRYLSTVFHVANTAVSLPFGAVLGVIDLAMVAAAILYLLFLYLVFFRVRLGVQMRAVAEAPVLASQRGINIYWIFGLSWSVAILGASIAGILYGLNSHLNPEMGPIGLMAIPAAIVGGMDSFAGVIPGAILVGVTQGIVYRYVDPIIGNVVPMVILLIVLILKPWGFFGTKEEIERV
ncbi:MAG: branched-chain amino acid ABC transporter permease [Chloroflexota bacterium]